MNAKELFSKVEAAMFDATPSDKHEIGVLLDEIRQLKNETGIEQAIDAGLNLCQRLYFAGRSSEALEIARIALAQSVEFADQKLLWRAQTAVGNLLADAGEHFLAVEHHATASLIGEQLEDPELVARAWSNLGAAFYYGAAYEMAIESYSRAIKTSFRHTKESIALYSAYMNLSQCYLNTSNVEDGLQSAARALKIETPAMLISNRLNAVLLRRNYVRLLVLAGRSDSARCHVEEAWTLSARDGTPRTAIAAMSTKAIFEVGIGNQTEGLARLYEAVALAKTHPVALSDTLQCMVQAEEMCGNRQNAEHYSQLLAENIFREFSRQTRGRLHSPAWTGYRQIAPSTEMNVVREGFSHYGSDLNTPEWETLERIAATVSLKRDAAVWHGPRVGELTRLLALAAGLSPDDSFEIGCAARIHDVGMIVLPDALLARRGEWTTNQRDMIRKHCQAGHEMIAVNTEKRTQLASLIAQHHHEWWNGEGYPNQLSGNSIPLSARLCTVADVFDALISARSYRPPLSIESAVERLQGMRGIQLDPDLVDHFIHSLRGGAIGSFIDSELSSAQTTAQSLDSVIESLCNTARRHGFEQ